MILNKIQVTEIFAAAGFKGAALDAAVKICECESGFNTLAHNTAGEDSRGLMQINVNVWTQFKNQNLFDPYINAAAAHYIYTKANNTFRDWTCARMLNLVNPTNIILIAGIAFLIGIYYVYTI